MINIPLFDFQESCSLFLVDKVSQDSSKQTITIKAPTGAGKTIILITHYMEEVVGSDYTYVMDQGKVVMEGTPREVFSQVEKLKSYRLTVPQITELAYELKKEGMALPDGILTRQELIEALREYAATR